MQKSRWLAPEGGSLRRRRPDKPRLSAPTTYTFLAFGIRVESETDHAHTEVRRVYEAFAGATSTDADAVLTIRRRGEKYGVRLIGPGVPDEETLVDTPQLARCAEHKINRCLVEALGGHLLLHAAGVSRRSAAILLPGKPGSGKTSLAARLVELGCGYITDELVIADFDSNRVMPFPKALTLKPGSFDAFDHLATKPSNLDGHDVWYLCPERLRRGSVVQEPSSIRLIVFPRYCAGSRTDVTHLSIGETVLGLFETAVNIARHKEHGLDHLIRIAQGARGYGLPFGDLDQACEAILGIVEDEGLCALDD